MPTSWGSDVVNGQLVPRPPSSAFFPLVLSAQYTGPGFWPRQGSYQVPPVVANPLAAASMAPSGLGTGPAMGQYSGAQVGSWHPTRGTIFFGFFALVAGLFLLN